MPRTPTRASEPWASGVEEIPIRQLTLSAWGKVAEARGLGFSRPELERLQSHFRRVGRDPTDLELAGLAQSWSEHCSYKSSRPLLKRAFGRLHPGPRVLGTGDAGVVRLVDGIAYALRIESHNHPSAVEPYGGAATGIGGILRDVLAVGAKPVALADPLFFGPLDLPPERVPSGIKTPRYLMEGVVAGIRDYGNRVGVPTVSGGIYFDPAYTVNPLVNVACVGLLPRRRLRPNRASRVGNRLVLTGGLTGRDGIGGVAFASRELTERSEEESRGAVQLGDPLMKEPLIHACLEAFDRGLVRGVKDLGGGGLATASGELTHAGGFGLRVELANVPLRETALRPWEIWISESQERMLLEVPSENTSEVLRIFRRNDVPASVVGEVADGPFEEIRSGGRLAGRLDLGFRVDPPPARRAVRRRKVGHRTVRVPDDELGTLAQEMILAADSVSRERVIRVYDQDVQGRSVLHSLQGKVTSPSHGDASVLRPDPERWTGLALCTAAQPWACRENPRRGAGLVVEEAARNLYAVGARPDSFTNCLNFGNPGDPRVMGEFADVVSGLAASARGVGFVVPSGNVSFYNGGLGAEILPTPVIMAVGILSDLRRAVTSDLKVAGDPLYLVGRSQPEMGGSLFARRRGLWGLEVPRPDPVALRRSGDQLLRAGSRGLVRAAHDVSDGGLAVTLAEMAFGGELGFTVDLEPTGLIGPGAALIAEGASRWVVEVPWELEARFARGFSETSLARIGEVDASRTGRFLWTGEERARLDLRSLYTSWRSGLDAT